MSSYMDRPAECPHCRVDLEDRVTEVSCWKCGWEVRAVDGIEYLDRSAAIADRSVGL
jgi:hypothetical protein